jgi:hypothetical protein
MSRTKKPEWLPSVDDRALLVEHLFYEVQTFFDLAQRLVAPPSGHVDITERNAFIESFAIHLRQLIDFFWSERHRTEEKMDAFAADYFPPGIWDAIRPDPGGSLTVELRRKVGWGIAHLTYDRAWVPPAGKDWDVERLASALVPVVVEFADSVDHDQFVVGDWVRGMRTCALMFSDGVRARRSAGGAASV